VKAPGGSKARQLERLERAGLRLLTDERLAKLAAGGDRLAFEQIFGRYHQDLYAYCASLLHNRDDAADAVQSTMLRALRALDGERRHIAVRPWLYRIAHNESMELLRRPRSAGPSGTEVVSVGDVEADAATRAHLRSVLKDIRELPDAQRSALVMRELSGLEYSEIADALDTSPAAAKQAVYEARQALHELARGRESDCATIRLKISDGDRRVFRGRTVSAHLRACSDCRSFQATMSARQKSLAAFTPAMPAAAAAKMLHGAFGGGAAGAAAGSAAGIGASVAAPAVAAIAVAVALGAGAVGVHNLTHDGDRAPAGGLELAQVDRQSTAKAAAVVERQRAGGRRAAVRRASAGRGASATSARRARARAAARAAAGGRSGTHGHEATASGAGASQSSGSAQLPARTRSGGTGIGSWVRGGPSGGSAEGGGRRGPIRSQIDDTRTTVQNTVDQVQGALPVQTPQVPQVVPPRVGGRG
jgi:RNA polymerase sigma factor (sigma-70 family)